MSRFALTHDGYCAVVGNEEGMAQAKVGLRVALAAGVRGNGVTGEAGEGTISE